MTNHPHAKKSRQGRAKRRPSHASYPIRFYRNKVRNITRNNIAQLEAWQDAYRMRGVS